MPSSKRGGAGKTLRRLVEGKSAKQALADEYSASMKEAELHILIAKHLTDWAWADIFWWHTPNGEKRDYATAAKLRRMGVKSGVSDLLFLWRKRLYALEVKRLGEKPTLEQTMFGALVKASGGEFEIVDTFDAAVQILERWGMLRIKIAR